MESNNASQNENLKNAVCYIPLVAFILFFVESNKSTELMKHIKYGSVLFIGYIVLNIFLGWAIGALLFLLYIGIAGYLGFRAYSGEEIQLEHIDKVEKKIKESWNDIEKK